MKALLDNKTECTVLRNNGILASITNGKEIIIVFSFRLTYI